MGVGSPAPRFETEAEAEARGRRGGQACACVALAQEMRRGSRDLDRLRTRWRQHLSPVPRCAPPRPPTPTRQHGCTGTRAKQRRSQNALESQLLDRAGHLFISCLDFQARPVVPCEAITALTRKLPPSPTPPHPTTADATPASATLVPVRAVTDHDAAVRSETIETSDHHALAAPLRSQIPPRRARASPEE
jgi:hypothetical protein